MPPFLTGWAGYLCGYSATYGEIPRGLITLPLRQGLLISADFRFAAPRPIQFLRQHRLAPCPTLCCLAGNLLVLFSAFAIFSAEYNWWFVYCQTVPRAIWLKSSLLALGGSTAGQLLQSRYMGRLALQGIGKSVKISPILFLTEAILDPQRYAGGSGAALRG